MSPFYMSMGDNKVSTGDIEISSGNGNISVAKILDFYLALNRTLQN